MADEQMFKSELMGIREYARHRGCSAAGVLKAVRSHRIELSSEGKIDPVQADKDWRANTGPR
jgi:hypothetical protein